MLISFFCFSTLLTFHLLNKKKKETNQYAVQVIVGVHGPAAELHPRRGELQRLRVGASCPRKSDYFVSVLNLRLILIVLGLNTP